MTRQTAMKRYFTCTNYSRECCRKPCKVIFEDKEYTSFTNSWTLVLTTEDPGDIELFDTNAGRYPDVTELVNFDGIKRKVDFGEIFAEAKSRGYRLGKKEVDHRFKYLLKYDGTYYKLGLIDISYRIIDAGGKAMVYHPDGEKKPLTIQTELVSV